MSDFGIKYNSLNKQNKKEVNDFVDFLLSRQENNKDNSLSAYKNKILQVSQWSDSDICSSFGHLLEISSFDERNEI